jgi:hypothetical protein
MTDRKAIYQDKLLRREIWLKAKTESGLELTDEDITMCILIQERKKVSYFHDHIWANRRWDKNIGANRIVWTLTADGRRAIAHAQGLAGMDPIQFEEDDEGMPKVARVRVFRNQDGRRDEYWGEARWLEYAEKSRKGDLLPQWKKRPFAQLGKCAEMQALRRGFPEMEEDEPDDIVESVWSGDGVPTDTANEMEEERKQSKDSDELAQSAVRSGPRLVEPEISPEHEEQVQQMLRETEVEKDAPKSDDPEARKKAEEAFSAANPIEQLKTEAVPMFKAWAERFNGGQGMKWSEVYGRLTGVVLGDNQVMDANDYKILIEAFKAALKEEE